MGQTNAGLAVTRGLNMSTHASITKFRGFTCCISTLYRSRANIHIERNSQNNTNIYINH